MNSRFIVAIVVMLSFASFGSSPALAQVEKGEAMVKPEPNDCKAAACFPKQKSIAGYHLPLRGTALFRYWGFKVYSGGFYAPPGVDTIEKALGEQVKYLELHYHRELERQNFIDNSEYIFQQNPTVDLKTVQSELKQLYSLYTNVAEGDRYALLYEPGKGTTLFLNGQAQGTIPGSAFQRVYFGIWLSRYSVGEDFTKGLLGQ